MKAEGSSPRSAGATQGDPLRRVKEENINSFKERFVEPGVVAHVLHPRTGKAEAGGCLGMQD